MSKALCPKCKSENTTPIASNWLKKEKNLPLWFCLSCKYEWGKSEEVKDDKVVENEKF